MLGKYNTVRQCCLNRQFYNDKDVQKQRSRFVYDPRASATFRNLSFTNVSPVRLGPLAWRLNINNTGSFVI